MGARQHSPSVLGFPIMGRSSPQAVSTQLLSVHGDEAPGRISDSGWVRTRAAGGSEKCAPTRLRPRRSALGHPSGPGRGFGRAGSPPPGPVDPGGGAGATGSTALARRPAPLPLLRPSRRRPAVPTAAPADLGRGHRLAAAPGLLHPLPAGFFPLRTRAWALTTSASAPACCANSSTPAATPSPSSPAAVSSANWPSSTSTPRNWSVLAAASAANAYSSVKTCSTPGKACPWPSVRRSPTAWRRRRWWRC